MESSSVEISNVDEQAGTYDVIYVSPHLDDAVFSCAAHIQSQREQRKRVLVVSIFTAGHTASALPKASLEPFLNVDARREEDREAMRALGVDYYHMGLPEALIRHGGGRPWLWGPLEVAWIWAAGLVRSEREVQDQLAEQLRGLILKTQCPKLIGPAAIGMHPDHLVVYRACAQVAEQVPQMWHYYDFPYCTHTALTWVRRMALDMKGPLRDVEPELPPDRVESRKRLMGIYGSQVKACFGSTERLEAAVASCPNEQFLEVLRGGEEDDRSVLPLPSVARRSKDAALGILKRMLLVDLAISLFALYWVRHGLDWSDKNPHAMRFAYAVIGLSTVRVACLAVKSSLTLSWWLCVSSIFLTAAAFSYTAEVRSIILAAYYSVEMLLGCAEQSFANFVCKAKKNKGEQPMRVLVVSDYMPPQRHGIATHTHGLVCALRDSGCVVHVYTTSGTADGHTFFNWSMRNPWNADVRLSIMPSFRLIKTIFGGQWSVVHVVFPNFLSWPVMLAAWLAGVPVYASQHCDLERLGRCYVGGVIYNLADLAYRLLSYFPIYLFATIHAAPTNFYINSHPTMKNFDKQRLAVVPSSVDANIFHERGREEDRKALQSRLGLTEDRVIWLVVSRLAPEKDIPEVLQALKCYREQWPEEVPPPVLVIAGDGPLRKELEGIVARDGLPVCFLGFLSLPEVASLYRACDVCITNSVQETFGLTVIESMASGCPMVMPHCEVFDELYQESVSEWMYTKDDMLSLASTIRAASRPSAREHLAALRQGGRLNRALFWSWGEAAEEQAEQYRQAQAMVQARRALFGSVLRTLLMVISLLALMTVCVVSLASAGQEVHHFIGAERASMFNYTAVHT